MPTSYSVRFWKTEVYKGRKRSTYYVRWVVGGQSQRKPFVEKTLAESFRSELVTAARKGEAFDIESGLPVTMLRAGRELPWYALACEWADLKWPRAAATTRQTHAYALTQLTAALLTGPDRGRPEAKVLRKALSRWAFTPRREAPDAPVEVRVALRWVAGHTAAVSALADPLVLRPLLDALTVKLDGRPAAASVVSRRRKILVAVVGYAVERQLLAENPLPALRWTAPKSSQAIDRRRVPNPVQACTLLGAVRQQPRSGARLVAFFGCLYFAGLRPEEAVALATCNLAIPAKGWGRLHVEWAEPHVGREWTDNRQNRDRRQLKQRAVGEVRLVPCPPELTALLNWHIGVRDRPRRPDLHGRAQQRRAAEGDDQPGLAACSRRGVHIRGGGQLAGRGALRPAACLPVDVAEQRGAGGAGRGVGRPLSRDPAPDLCQVHRRRG
jgi:integrase